MKKISFDLEGRGRGATTFGIVTLSIMCLFETSSRKWHSILWYSVEECSHYAECRFFNVKLTLIILSIVLVSVVMLSLVMLSVVMLSVVMLSVVMLSVFMMSVLVLSVLVLSFIVLSVVILTVVILSVIILNAKFHSNIPGIVILLKWHFLQIECNCLCSQNPLNDSECRYA